MLIYVKFKDSQSGKNDYIIVDDATSPDGGYTQAHADRVGMDYVESSANERHGEGDWEFVSARYV